MIREALVQDLPVLSALALRSKAHWGYDDAFMAACVAELTFKKAHLGPDLVAWDTGVPVGVARVSVAEGGAHLEGLFIDPDAMGLGIGRRLFGWAVDRAKATGAKRITIDSDPYAEPFYLRMGAVRVGEMPSGSIPGRMLPRLSLLFPKV